MVGYPSIIFYRVERTVSFYENLSYSFALKSSMYIPFVPIYDDALKNVPLT